MTNAHDPTFPNIGDHAGPMPGLTAIEHAALVTGQPCSGTPWLDDMIRAQRRERLAGQIAAQLATTATPEYWSVQVADNLIAALEGGGK